MDQRSHTRDEAGAVTEPPAGATATVDSGTSPAETALIAYLRRRAGQVDPASPAVRDGWAYPSPYHLLLEAGRLFTPAPLPPGMGRLGKGFCYANAARTIEDHPGFGLVYAEGYGTWPLDGTYVHVPHGWAANSVPSPATAVDPTWPDEPDCAYLGIPFADPGVWPHPLYGAGVLQELRTLLPILRHGLPKECIADLGRPLPGDHHDAQEQARPAPPAHGPA